MTRSTQTLISVGSLLVATLLIVAMLPRGGLGTDLSQVGAGRPAVVLVFENHAPTSMDTLALLSRLQTEYPNLVFLVADLGIPEGSSFAQRHAGAAGSVLRFDGDGQLLGRGFLSDEASLRARLQSHGW